MKLTCLQAAEAIFATLQEAKTTINVGTLSPEMLLHELAGQHAMLDFGEGRSVDLSEYPIHVRQLAVAFILQLLGRLTQQDPLYRHSIWVLAPNLTLAEQGRAVIAHEIRQTLRLAQSPHQHTAPRH